MGSTLTDFDDSPEGEVETATEGPAADITVDDLGEDKELNAPPEAAPEDDEPEADKPEGAEAGAEKEPDPEPKPAGGAPKPADADKTAEEKAIQAILDNADKDGPLKVKGQEFSAKDFTREELRSFVQRGIRMTQIGTALAQRERAVTERERVAEANAVQATRLLSQAREAPSSKATTVQTEPPEELQPSDYDTEDVRALKAVALNQWKQNQEQTQRLNQIEGGLKDQQTEVETQKFFDELQAHRADFPLASTEEVIAVHSLRPDIPLSDLVRRSHAIYGSVEHVDEVFKHAPEVKKVIGDRFIAAYLARNSKARVVPEKPSTQGGRTSHTASSKVRNFEDAGQMARKMLAQVQMESEADND